MAEPLRRRGARGRIEVRRLRAGVLRLGASLGLNTQTVLRFSEVITGQRWRRCHTYEFEQVATELARIGGRMRRVEEVDSRTR